MVAIAFKTLMTSQLFTLSTQVGQLIEAQQQSEEQLGQLSAQVEQIAASQERIEQFLGGTDE